MTQALPRVRPSTVAPPATAAGVAPLWVRGAFAALWTVTVGVAGLVVVVLAMWAADARSQASAGVATRFALVVYLAAMHVPMHVATGGTVALAPLGLTVGLVLLLERAASIVARGHGCTTARELGAVVGVVVGPYVVLCLAIAILARSSQITPSLPGTVVAAVITGLLATVAGVMRGSGSGRAWWARLPADARAGFGAAAAGVVVLLGVAALLLVGSLALHTQALRAGLSHFGGGLPVEASVVVLCLVLVPNAVVCALGYLTGPGFALGAGTSYTLGGVHAAPVPTLPVLAGRPLGSAPASVVVLCVAAIVLAGGVTGWRLARRPETHLVTGLRQAALAGAAAGVLTAVLSALAGGPAGPGALSAVGSSPWQVGVSVAGELMLPAAVVVVTWIWLVRLPAVAALPGRSRQLLARLKR